MATLTRTNPRVGPAYKDYVNFLGGYKNGKKDNENSNNNVPVANFPLSSSSSNTSSSSLSSDVPDFSKNSCQSYNSFLENSKNKKFCSVKANWEEKGEKPTKKSEIFIEIQPAKSVSEVSKIFESKQDRKSPTKAQGINSKISIFEKQISTENKPKIAEKPVLKVTSPPPPKLIQENGFKTPSPPPPPPPAEIIPVNNIPHVLPPPPPPMPSVNSIQKPLKIKENGVMPPPPPPVPKLQATLTRGPQTKYSVSNPNGTIPNEIDRNDPLVRKLVYGTLRGLYGAYHDKASDMLATLPRNMVVKSNGVQDRIDQIAANGDLDKLNGRVNPKLEQE